MNKQKSDFYPFVKWVGGKRNVIKNYLHNLFPKKFNKYIEPFVGGGAVLMYLKPKNAIINDTNYELITSYEVIKKNPNSLIEKLDLHLLNHNKDYFYKIRENIPTDKIECASRFIYLNKSCFNGMYRVNKNNKFNVPFNGKEKNNLNLYDKDNILNLSKYLNENNIEFFNKSFEFVINMAEKNDFIFCDPPYDYDNKGFDSYTQKPFGKNGQLTLFDYLDKLSKKGVKWMLTNHNTKLINELYKNYKCFKIKTNRNINSNPIKRKNFGNEIVIINYEI